MKRLASPAAMWAGVAIIAITNAVMLGGAAMNRSGEPSSRLRLTERELAMPLVAEEGSTALSLTLTLGDQPPPLVRRAAWFMRAKRSAVEHAWLDRDKLASLGFRAELDPSDPDASEYYGNSAPRCVYVVLELEGAAWKKLLAEQDARVDEMRRHLESGTVDRKQLEEAETLLALDRTTRSRLVPIDAGLDADKLRFHYLDRSRYAIVHCAIRLAVVHVDDEAPKLETLIIPLAPDISVPNTMRPSLERFIPRESDEKLNIRLRTNPAWPAAVPPRYEAELAIGQSYVPWLVRVTSLPK